MEPGHRDRETEIGVSEGARFVEPQWTLVTKTRKTDRSRCRQLDDLRTAMEPGPENREDTSAMTLPDWAWTPQWSPVTKTGKTGAWVARYLQHT